MNEKRLCQMFATAALLTHILVACTVVPSSQVETTPKRVEERTEDFQFLGRIVRVDTVLDARSIDRVRWEIEAEVVKVLDGSNAVKTGSNLTFFVRDFYYTFEEGVEQSYGNTYQIRYDGPVVNPYSGSVQIIRFSPVQHKNQAETLVETVSQIKRRPPFRAEVLAVYVRESTNLAAEFSMTNSSALVTNTYAGLVDLASRSRRFAAKFGLNESTDVVTNIYDVRLKDDHGFLWAMFGFNATGDELTCIKRLKKGKTYTFPKALTK